MPDHALELSFDEAGDAAIRAHWAALQRAGLPSQADHTGTSNAPHLTLLAARGVPAGIVGLAGEWIEMPQQLSVRGMVLFGEGSRVTVAHLIEPDPLLAQAVASLRAAAPAVRHPLWTPHVTLARRVPRASVPAVLDVLGRAAPVRRITADRLRWWDPVAQVIEDVRTGDQSSMEA